MLELVHGRPLLRMRARIAEDVPKRIQRWPVVGANLSGNQSRAVIWVVLVTLAGTQPRVNYDTQNSKTPRHLNINTLIAEELHLELSRPNCHALAKWPAIVHAVYEAIARLKLFQHFFVKMT